MTRQYIVGGPLGATFVNDDEDRSYAAGTTYLTTSELPAITGTLAATEVGGVASTVAFGSAGTYLSYGSRASTVLAAPAGITNGDLLIAYVFVGSGIAPTTPTAPAGWSTLPGSPITNSAGGFFGNYSVFYKIASGESGSYTFSHVATYSTCGVVIRYTGVDTTTPFSPTPTGNSGTGVTATALGFTTTNANTFVIFTEHDWGDNTTDCVPPTGTTPTFTERVDQVILYIADGTLATAGATGNKSHTSNSIGSNPWSAYLIGLNPLVVAGGDTASIAGGIDIVAGPLQAYEGLTEITADSTLYTADSTVIRVDTAFSVGDTAAFAGTVGATAATGTLAATESADTAAFTGTAVTLGVLVTTEASDTVSITGVVGRSGTLAATEATTDTASFAGTVRWFGTLAATEGADTALFTGTAVTSGTLGAIEAADTFAAAGTVAFADQIVGSILVTEGADTASINGTVTGVAGTLAATDGASIAAFTGTVGWAGVLAATEFRDAAAFTGTVVTVAGISGVLNAFESQVIIGITADSTLIKADSTLITADSDIWTVDLGADDATFNGLVTGFVGRLAAVEGADIALFSGPPLVFGILAVAEEADTAAFEVEVFIPPKATGVLAAVEEADTALFYGGVIIPWDDIGAGLEDEVARTIWLSNLSGRELWLKNEVEETNWLRNPGGRVVSLVAEQRRITELRP